MSSAEKKIANAYRAYDRYTELMQMDAIMLKAALRRLSVLEMTRGEQSVIDSFRMDVEVIKESYHEHERKAMQAYVQAHYMVESYELPQHISEQVKELCNAESSHE